MDRRLVVAAIAITAAMLAPLVVFGSVVRGTIARDVVERSAEERQLAARLAAASIDRELRSAGDVVSFFVSGPTLRSALAARDRGALDARLRELLQGRRNSLGAVLDPAGVVLAAPLAPDLVGQDFSRRDYFKGALGSSGPYVSEIFASASPGNPSVVAVSVAIRSGATVLGVAVLTLLPADVLDVLRPLDQIEGREMLIVDAAGLAVASTDLSFVPLAATDLASGTITPSNDIVVIAGRERVVTEGRIDIARWTLYVLDDPAVILRAERSLQRDLGRASAAVLAIALAAAAAVILLYGTTARQRDQLRAGRAVLANTNAALEEAGRHKTDFLASMSHELRTPLNAILGFSELLDEQAAGALTERQHRYLRNIGDAGRHLLGLINDVLDLSKVEAGRVDLRPELTSTRALLDPVITSTRAAAEAGGVSFDVAAPDETMLQVDIGRVRQILYNLLSNAVKFTPSGGSVELLVAVEGNSLDITVSDTGIGIPEDKRDRVFGTFERLHEGRFAASGTGLGLALTKRLVELHAGGIAFSPRAGGGTIFHVRLPDVVAMAHADERVLVVEDERRDADLIVALAARSGLDSEVVTSVAAATDAIRRSPPTAVVLDMRLAGERGERVLEVLKADPATRAVPVVVVTVEDDEGRSRELGADDHITKPIDHDRLSGWLDTVASSSRRERSAVADPVGR